ncbi:caspase-7-like [Pecten maximus]|uniref:caspase-7-like n=1 Tax=Pecten maximus TaxID=6579 RepID=UPI00145915ED|nr:caspase-7-like [Pecten maximus]
MASAALQYQPLSGPLPASLISFSRSSVDQDLSLQNNTNRIYSPPLRYTDSSCIQVNNVVTDKPHNDPVTDASLSESMDDLETDGLDNQENLSCNLYLDDEHKSNNLKSDIENDRINFVDESQETAVKSVPGESCDQWPQENGCAFKVKAVDMDRRQPTKETVEKTIIRTHQDFVSAEYRHDHLYRGRCLIVSNSEFRDKKNRPKRDGSLRDARTLRNQFLALGFHPIRTKDGSDEMIHQNLSPEDLLQILSEVTDPSLNDHSDYDCFACVILSYGLEGAVVCPGETEDVYLEINSILEHFTPQKCPSLAMKPKLFFIQGCTPYEIIQNQAMAKTPSSTTWCPMMKTVIPSMADCLVQFSGVDGCLGWGRKRNRGLSYYVQALCQTLKKFCILKLEQGQKSQEMTSLLLRINRAFTHILEDSDIDMDETYCVPLTYSTLTKQMYFYPKSPQDDLETG